MRRGGRIDRQKHEVDVAERVLEGGVWAGTTLPAGARVVAIDLGVKAWSFAAIETAVQLPPAKFDRDKS